MGSAWWQKESLIKIESPTSMMVVGPSSSGKTELVKRLLFHANGVFKQAPTQIMICYRIWQKAYTEMQTELRNITFMEGLPSKHDIVDWASSNKESKVLLLDDMMMTVDSADVADLFCVGSHHFNITVIHLIQNLYHKGKEISYKFKTLVDKYSLGRINYFMDAYNKATADRYGYLVVDISPHTDKSFQLRTNILPGEAIVVYQPAKQ
ncbi:hypothetical protein FSP39_007320 [Pinctada imbricata]|uniref:AAA+ ATPase domain-containing protein n=1 Tax=Pinctada imbricata TaxID=66713 RepID=A0AA88YKL9_PINIB|nr:hypothetical protein FSP39_007320 [Pinctada imbricata]